jgi:hypothetical protein
MVDSAYSIPSICECGGYGNTTFYPVEYIEQLTAFEVKAKNICESEAYLNVLNRLHSRIQNARYNYN